jgi:hypothetical protein
MKNHNHKHGLFIVSINMLIISFLGSNYTWAEIEPDAQAVKFYPQVITLNAENFHKIPQLPIVFDGKTYQYDEYMKSFEDGLEITVYLTQKKNETGETVLYAVRADEADKINFEKLSVDLISMEPYFAGNQGDMITFDSKLASQAGFSKESIQLAKEMTALTNNIVNQLKNAETSTHTRSSTPKLDTVDINIDNYHLLQKYFAAAKTADASPKRNARSVRGWCSWALSDTACYCGSFFYPRPNIKNPYKHYPLGNDPEGLVKSWGFHKTQIRYGGGWTRPQTYNPRYCGEGTYRDHIGIDYKNKRIVMQNYEGFTPRGEPNPEIFADYMSNGLI